MVVLAPTASFEETVHLFWNGSLPSRNELDGLERELAERRELPEVTHEVLRAAADAAADPMDALRTAASTLSLLPGAGNNEEDARRLVAAFPTIVAAYARLRAGEQPIAPDPSLLVVQTSRAEEIVAAVRRLTPKDREIVMLYAWEDLPRETIAQMMGMTRSALDQRIHRANQRLARMLEPQAEPIPSPPIAQEGGGS